MHKENHGCDGRRVMKISIIIIELRLRTVKKTDTKYGYSFFNQKCTPAFTSYFYRRKPAVSFLDLKLPGYHGTCNHLIFLGL